MKANNRNISTSRMLIAFSVIINGVALTWAYTRNSEWYWALLVTIPLLFVTLINAGREKELPANINAGRLSRRMQRRTKSTFLKTKVRLKKTARSFELNDLN